jgi:hypothetical protein
VLEACFAQRGLLRATLFLFAPAPSLPNRAARSFAEFGKLGRIASAGAVAALVIGLVLSVLIMSTPARSTPEPSQFRFARLVIE